MPQAWAAAEGRRHAGMPAGERAAAGKVDLAEDKGPAAPGGLHVFLLWRTCSSSCSVNGRHGLAPMSAAACRT